MKRCEDSSSFQAEKLSTNYLRRSFHSRVPFENVPEEADSYPFAVAK
jgi:hypothetical protein